jgi:toxin ParE1/3/4
VKHRRVVFAPEARNDLFELYDWIAATAGASSVAISYVERIEAYCLGFDIVSERGHRRDDIFPGLRIVGFERRVTIVFAVDDDRVSILPLFYGVGEIGNLNSRDTCFLSLGGQAFLPTDYNIKSTQCFGDNRGQTTV